MNRTHRQPRPAARRRPRAGFAFTEVLFAVMVLGLGFIMIAAMFPVTISQTQTTVQETAAAGVARGAFQALAQCPKLAKLDATGANNKTLAQCPFKPISAGGSANVQEVWQELAGNFIDSQNPRYAWTVLYRRAVNDKVAQVIVIATQNPTGGPYTVGAHVVRPGKPADNIEAVLEPKQVALRDLVQTAEGTEIHISKSLPTAGSVPKKNVEALVREGAYLVIADAGGTPLNASYYGRIFQLGPRLDSSSSASDPMIFQAQAGTELDGKAPSRPSPLGTPGATAYIVGRSYTDNYLAQTNPLEPTNELDFTGTTQEIGIYTGYIQIP